MSDYVELGVFSRETAERYAAMVLSENARRIYRL